MEKKKLIALPICFGLILIICSWYLSYPLSIDSPLDFTFNHVSPLYWIGLSVFLASLYLAAVTSKNNIVKLAICIGIVLSMYSIRYFFYLLPSSDAHTVRGLTEYAIATGDLDPSKPHHSYFQWPFFFILDQMATSITGLEVTNFEFVLFAIFGVFYVLALYVYAFSFSKGDSYIAIVAYFVVMYWFLNYQFAPFSLAMVLLFTLFMLETRIFKTRTRELTLATMILFTSITFVHPFAGVLFIAYTFMMYLISRSRNYLQLFVLTLVVYLVVSIFFTRSFFPDVVKQLTIIHSGQYAKIVERTFSTRIAPAPAIDTIAQMFSRAIVLSTGIVVSLGFLFLLLRKKLRQVDLAIFFSATFYAAAGAFLPILSQRGWFILLMPMSLGATYFSKSRFKKHLKSLFLVLMILFPLIPLTESFSDTQIFFQTKNEYQCANFMVDYHNWTRSSSILSHFRLMNYLKTRTASGAFFKHDLNKDFPENIVNYDCIVYTVGLGKNFLLHNYSMVELYKNSSYNSIFDSGSSHVLVKTKKSGV